MTTTTGPARLASGATARSILRVAPQAWIGVTAWLLYSGLVFVVQKHAAIPYPEWGNTAANLWRAADVSLVAGGVLMALLTGLLGWWKPVLFDRSRARLAWAWIVPIAMIALTALGLIATDYSAIAPEFLLTAIILGVLVGFAEEMMARGVLLTGLRARLGERSVWLLTSLMFGAFHIVNLALGAPAIGAVQVITAGLSGSIFYVARRLSGTLVLPMLLHGAWDFMTFVQGKAPAFGAHSDLIVIVGLVSLIAAWKLTADPYRSQARPASLPTNIYEGEPS
ncbi:CPBP family intramembrane glutamic endopeptidase [Demequina sp. NBRC 110057]|uniref:CPBP family intramembrane glutamic endopeptidase n=1 Tax=Demequina sp. NBRC 110057 TaxID=1570346 RepID=UPI0009FE9D0D|nr:CPBP family intramembrane glutamic endopeptidase [Demequina sp. NBRC 110057]